MTYQVVVPNHVRQQILDAFEYIAQDSPMNATRWLSGAFETIDQLASLPEGHAIDEAISIDEVEPVRKCAFGNYIIHFRIRETQQRVEVVSFRHGARLPDTFE